jgi:hypothetical protein
MSDTKALEEVISQHYVLTGTYAGQAAAELAQLKAENEQLKGSITCGVPLGYHEEEQQMEWCGKLIVTGMCAEHWDEFMQLRAERDEMREALSKVYNLAWMEGVYPAQVVNEIAMISSAVLSKYPAHPETKEEK